MLVRTDDSNAQDTDFQEADGDLRDMTCVWMLGE
jgi:hypothetical protein